LALDGNNDEEYWHLQGVTAVWKNHMLTAKIPHVVADFALRQVLLPTLKYPLLAMMLTEKQCQTILQPVLYHSLPAMGVNWTSHGSKSEYATGSGTWPKHLPRTQHTQLFRTNDCTHSNSG